MNEFGFSQETKTTKAIWTGKTEYCIKIINWLKVLRTKKYKGNAQEYRDTMPEAVISYRADREHES